jgi:Domain of Unknown Function (DUF1080)
MLMLLLVFSLFVQVAAVQGIVLRTFDDDKTGAPPAGFALAAGREASADQWGVRREGKGGVLAHTGLQSPRDSFALAVFSGAQYGDAEISVRLKATGGGRSAGLVFKYQDPMNHYAVQLDLANQDLAMYRVVSGNRIRLEREDDLELDPEAWHALKVVQDGDEIRVYLGGIRVFTDRDRTPHAALSVGLWSAGDTTVLFDDFRIEPDHNRRP